jgi:AbiTii
VSSLVLELQADAIDPSVSVLNLLRKALVVAKKLSVQEFQAWIDLELAGYDGTPIPEYRSIWGQLRGWNQFHGWQPITTDDQDLEKFCESVCNLSIRQSISELVALSNSENNELHMQLPFQIESFLVRTVGTSVKIGISRASVQAIVEAARDVILHWALKLEEDGITGEGMTFSREEKQIAANHDYRNFIQVKVEQTQMQNSSSESRTNAETFNNYLGGANIANFANKVQDNGQQVASNFSQNINQNVDEIMKIIASLREMAQEFPEVQREEAMVHLDDLQEDISTPEKQKPQRIKTRIAALLTVAGLVAGTADFANNVLELSGKLGVPANINIPQVVQNLPTLSPPSAR